MTTWISRTAQAAVLCAALPACDPLPGSTPAVPSDGPPLEQVSLLGGAVALVAPDGYCIDRASLRADFAVLARCDTLSGTATGSDALLSVITASFGALDPAEPLPATAQIEATSAVHAVAERIDADDMRLVRATGPARTARLSTVHWRGVARIGAHLAAVALYGPENSPATKAPGARVLIQMVDRSRSATSRLKRLQNRSATAGKTGGTSGTTQKIP